MTRVPVAKFAAHVEPQEITAGLDVTVPVPVFRLVRVTVSVETAVKVAVTLFALVIERMQLPVPVHAPDQPAKADPAAAAAVSVTDVPLVKDAEHVLPQEMPAGLEVTVPEPVPDFETASAVALEVKVAVTLLAAVIETVQVPVPEQPSPDHPLNTDPTEAAALSVTEVP